MSYITDELEHDITKRLGGATLAAKAVPAPPPKFLANLPAEARRALEALHARVVAGTFPDLYDFNVDWGADTNVMRNVDPDTFALANDGSGNYWLLCQDGTVRSWCHDEGGHMEDHNQFSSLDDALACIVLYSAVRMELATLDDVRPTFEAAAKDNGWQFFLEMLDDL
jgi:hypothetical protein